MSRTTASVLYHSTFVLDMRKEFHTPRFLELFGNLRPDGICISHPLSTSIYLKRKHECQEKMKKKKK